MKYDLEGICQDCMYLEKIKPLFEEKDKEIDRLNNIINELEKSLKAEYDYCDKHLDPAYGTGMGVAKRILDKLKALKENNNA